MSNSYMIVGRMKNGQIAVMATRMKATPDIGDIVKYHPKKDYSFYFEVIGYSESGQPQYKPRTTDWYELMRENPKHLVAVGNETGVTHE